MNKVITIGDWDIEEVKSETFLNTPGDPDEGSQTRTVYNFTYKPMKVIIQRMIQYIQPHSDSQKEKLLFEHSHFLKQAFIEPLIQEKENASQSN